MNSDRTRIMMLCLLAIIGFISLTGCQNRLKAERDALYMQNQELQEELDLARAALHGDSGFIMDVNTVGIAPATGFDSIEGIEAYVSGGTVTVRVPGDILFSSGKVSLKGSAKETLNQIAGVIKSDYPGNTIRVEGYTDADPIRKSKWKDNLELSLQRAAAVHRQLQSQGVSSENLYAAGFGQARPQATKDKSRRVEIVVVLQE